MNKRDRDELRKIILQRNAARARPRPVCPGCRLPFFASERDWLFADFCSTCGTNRRELSLQTIARCNLRQLLDVLLCLAE